MYDDNLLAVSPLLVQCLRFNQPDSVLERCMRFSQAAWLGATWEECLRFQSAAEHVRRLHCQAHTPAVLRVPNVYAVLRKVSRTVVQLLVPLKDHLAEYRLIAKKGEGTFSEVLKAQCVKNGKMTAIKCMKSQFESEEQVL